MFIDLEQNTPEWLEFRRTKIGASEAAAIMGMSPWKTAVDLWEEKRGIKEVKCTYAMTHGSNLEPEAREAFNNYLMVATEPRVVQSDEHPWQIASIDALNHEEKVLGELKCPLHINSHLVAMAGEVPEHYWVQIQHQLAVLGYGTGYYFSYFKGEHEIIEVKRDDEFIKRLIIEEKKFHDLLIDNVRPPLTAKDCELITSESFIETSEKYKDIVATITELELEKENLKQELILLANEKNSKGNGVKIKKETRKGAISYKKMPEELLTQVESFRGKPTSFWKVYMSNY